MTVAPVLSFIVPVRDDAVRLRQCLQSIARSRGHIPIEIVVADNGSVDGSVEVAERAGAVVLRLPGVCVSELRNAAAKAASGGILAFVDADHEIDAAWVATAVATLRGPSVGAAGASYEAPPDGTWVQRTYDALRRRQRRAIEVDWLASGNLVVWQSVFESLHGFDTTLETCEDVDFCRRLRERGYLLIEDPRLRSIHHGDPASLKALFLSELWRGRDNVRASLRGRLRLRELPSIAVPIAELGLLLAAAAGVLMFSPAGVALSASAVAPLVALAVLRASMMSRRRQSRNPVHFLQSIPVAIVYDAARALALVARTRHQVRRRA